MMTILDWLVANLTLVIAIQQGVFSAASAICELFKWTTASKVFGTLTSLDLGRIVRNTKAFSLVKTGSVSLLVLLVGCAAGQPRPQVSVQSAVEVATWAVVLTDDALVVAAQNAPDTPTLDRIEQATDLLDGARGALSEGTHTIGQVCEALGQVSQVATIIDCQPCNRSIKAALEVVCQ